MGRDSNFEYSIRMSEHLKKDLPIWKISIEAQKCLNKAKHWIPINTGNLQDSVLVDVDAIDKGRVGIYLDTDYYMDYQGAKRYYRYTDEKENSHYRKGKHKGMSTQGWWDRLCEEFKRLWNEKSETLESVERKPTDNNASASKHDSMVEKGEIRKLATTTIDKKEIEVVVNTKTKQTSRFIITDLLKMGIEPIQKLLVDSLGVKIPLGLARSKGELRTMKSAYIKVSKEYGEIEIGGLKVRTIIRELIRKLKDSPHINAR